ncbi:CD1375 family protein [Schinkia azotoformans]|nr:CD1375 family protein [Schinkia azotoformans]MEC1637328.1 CD1375 family protein [Schinkia azotoformans]MEC1943732.1 CD1375 family protein [Schinkia azotoformans]
MAQIYVNLIKKGLKTLDEVPQNLKSEVESILAVDHAN